MKPPGPQHAVAAAIVKDQEPIPELPPPLAHGARQGTQLAHEIVGQFLPNLALTLIAIAIGEETKSLHTRWQAAQAALNLYGMAGESPPDMTAAQQRARQALSGVA